MHQSLPTSGAGLRTARDGGRMGPAQSDQRRSRNQTEHIPPSQDPCTRLCKVGNRMFLLFSYVSILLCYPCPCLCLPILQATGRDGMAIRIPVVWHRANIPRNLACCRCQVLSQCCPESLDVQSTEQAPCAHLSVFTTCPRIRLICGSSAFGQHQEFST